MKRWDIINSIIEKKSFQTYLEIGVFKGQCFSKIRCNYKDGVDPCIENGNTTFVNFKLESDDFFKQNKTKYDLIFIDGLHHKAQVDKDIINSLEHTIENGIIILHDCNPPTEAHAAVPRIQTDWNGDVYKSILEFQKINDKHHFFTIDTDWGIGVIIKNKPLEEIHEPNFYQKGIDNWNFFDKNRKKLLNLIDIKEFKNKLDGI